ncbi:atherin-like [Microtus ochrogaster]|uniref:Atherin-like n=1 Tax=Microtus ochrogaster TaxID=79684 RepID=A0ABM1AUR4_MICOH|nr:atherin-like [Microtus ochrogaster]
MHTRLRTHHTPAPPVRTNGPAPLAPAGPRGQLPGEGAFCLSGRQLGKALQVSPYLRCFQCGDSSPEPLTAARSQPTRSSGTVPAAPPPGCEPGFPAQHPRRGPATAGLSRPSPPPPAPALLSLLPARLWSAARRPPPEVRPYPGRQAGAHSSAEPPLPCCPGPTRTHSPSAANQRQENRRLVLSLALATTRSEGRSAHTPTSSPFWGNTLR